MENPHRVTVHKEKNRLYIDLYLVKIAQAEKIEDEIWAKSKQLKVGWGCIVNYTRLDVPLTIGLLDRAETEMSFLKQIGMGQLVRVLTEKQSSLNDELNNRSMEAGGYEGIEARTIQDADAILDRISD
jgi:RNAse (barnase) inhibitor barstar